jgi:hypothetical protein
VRLAARVNQHQQRLPHPKKAQQMVQADCPKIAMKGQLSYADDRLDCDGKNVEICDCINYKTHLLLLFI